MGWRNINAVKAGCSIIALSEIETIKRPLSYRLKGILIIYDAQLII